MKTFNIYQFRTTGGHFEAIKDGWSWPGFFFTWIWAFVKGLTVLGISLLVASIILNYVRSMSITATLVVGCVGLIIMIWIGYNGNSIRERKLLEEGYDKIGSIEASSPENAVAEYEARFRNVVPVESL